MTNSRFSQYLSLLLIASVFVLGIDSEAFATLTTAICKIAGYFTGNAGRGIATIGIAIIGILATLGRVTWTQALVVGVGVSTIFAASSIAESMGTLSAYC